MLYLILTLAVLQAMHARYREIGTYALPGNPSNASDAFSTPPTQTTGLKTDAEAIGHAIDYRY